MTRFHSCIPDTGFRTVLVALLFALIPVMGHAYRATGIDCDKPRYTSGGLLVLDQDDGYRARCEAERAIALNYAMVVGSTRDILITASKVMPPPLWDDLIDHISRGNNISEWKWDFNDDGDVVDENDIAIFKDTGMAELANYWGTGLLDKTPMHKDWHDKVRMRLCLSNPHYNEIIIWIYNIKPGWRNRIKINKIVNAYLKNNKWDVQNYFTTCNGDYILAYSGMIYKLKYLDNKKDSGEYSEYCRGTDLIGTRIRGWETRNGLHVVPINAIRADGSIHPQRGKSLLIKFDQVEDRPILAYGETELKDSDYPILTNDKATFLIQNCRRPKTRDSIETEECDATINGETVKGSYVETFRYREAYEFDSANPSKPPVIILKPVNPDPDNPGNIFGVFPAAHEGHLPWSGASLFCNPKDYSDSVDDGDEILKEDSQTCAERWYRVQNINDHFIGLRREFGRKISYPKSWNQKDRIITTRIEDDCFRSYHKQSIDLPVSSFPKEVKECSVVPPKRTRLPKYNEYVAPGWKFIGTYSRVHVIKWYDRLWMINDGVYPRFGRYLPDIATGAEALDQFNKVKNGEIEQPPFFYDKVEMDFLGSKNGCVALFCGNVTSESCRAEFGLSPRFIAWCKSEEGKGYCADEVHECKPEEEECIEFLRYRDVWRF